MKKFFHNLLNHKPFLFILAIGIVIRLWHIDWSLPEVYEEATPFLRAWKMFNIGKEGLDLNPHFFNYPAFTLYLQFFVQSIHYGIGTVAGIYLNIDAFNQACTTNPTAFIILARLATMIFDWGTIIVVYRFTTEILNERAGIIGACLIAVNPLMITQSHLINVDTPLLFFTTVALFLTFKLFKLCSPRQYLWIGIAIGLATSSKYTGAFLLPIFLLAYLFKEHTLKDVVRSLISIRWLITTGIALVTFMVINPFIILDTNEFLKDFSFEQQHMVTGHLGVNAETNGFVYYLLNLIPEYLGWIVLLALACSFIFLILQKNKIYWFLVSFPILYLIIISTWNMRVERYLLPIIPIIVIIVAVGTTHFLEWIESTMNQKRLAPRIRSVVITGTAIIVLSFSSIYQTLSYQNQINLPDTRTLAKQWLSEKYPEGALLATGPFGIKMSTPKFREFLIPFTPTLSENLFMFYQTKWFEDFDLLIASDYDYGRFSQDTIRYKKVLQYYDSLRAHWSLLHEITSDNSHKGPTFWFYTYQHPSIDTFSYNLFDQLSMVVDKKEVLSFSEKLASVLFFKGKLRKSEELMRFSVQYDPANLRLLREYAWNLVKVFNYEEAITVSRRSLDINPQQPEMFTILGSSYLRLNQYDEAELALRQAILLNNKFEMPYLELELLYRIRGNVKGQYDILTKYLSVLPPDGAVANQIRERLSQLKLTP